VVGVDGTAASAAAVRWAVREARFRHAIIQLVCACYHDSRLRAPYAPWAKTPDQAERESAGRAQLSAAAAFARRHLPLAQLMTELADELPAQALLSRAVGAEMLVLGTTRPTTQPAGDRTSMGPVARTCLYNAPCPVVVVAPTAPQDRPDSAYASHGRRSPRSHPAAFSRAHKAKISAD